MDVGRHGCEAGRSRSARMLCDFEAAARCASVTRWSQRSATPRWKTFWRCRRMSPGRSCSVCSTLFRGRRPDMRLPRPAWAESFGLRFIDDAAGPEAGSSCPNRSFTSAATSCLTWRVGGENGCQRSRSIVPTSRSPPPRGAKLGSATHGMDDAFYLERYAAKQWAFAGMEHEGGQATAEVLTVGGKTPEEDR